MLLMIRRTISIYNNPVINICVPNQLVMKAQEKLAEETGTEQELSKYAYDFAVAKKIAKQLILTCWKYPLTEKGNIFIGDYSNDKNEIINSVIKLHLEVISDYEPKLGVGFPKPITRINKNEMYIVANWMFPIMTFINCITRDESINILRNFNVSQRK